MTNEFHTLKPTPLFTPGATLRQEHDLLGEREIPADAYFGIQTLRALENFQITGITLNHFPNLVKALAMVKKAAARANCELGYLQPELAEAIGKACDEILAGDLHDHFLVDMIQGGAGTSTNMNANEERCRELEENSIGLITAVTPFIGYENATRIAKEALIGWRSVKELVLEEGLLSEEALSDILAPENMTQPRKVALKAKA